MSIIAHTVGSKYAAGRDVADIAKLVRKDLAAARKDPDSAIPADAKIRVRISRYSMGQSIDVAIVLPRPSRVQVDRDYPGQWGYTSEAAAAQYAADAILQAYNYDNSESLTDYFECEFAGHATVDGPR